MAKSVAGYEELLRCAADPSDPLTLAFAGVMSSPHAMRLSPEQHARLLARYFPRLPLTALPHHVEDCEPQYDEYEDLVHLLLMHRADDDESTEWLAHALAAGCLGDNHLWQDMGLPSREVLSALIATHFPTLFARNKDNMKWKKFFYKQLCEQMGVRVCKAPSCKICVDYGLCFGSEDGPALRAVSNVA